MGSEAVSRLAQQVLADMFGARVARVAGDLNTLGVGSLHQVAGRTGLGLGPTRACLAVLVQHGLVTTSSTRRPGVLEYSIRMERVLGLLHLPAFLPLVRERWGEIAETLVVQAVRLGVETASNLVFLTAREVPGASVLDIFQQFKLLTSQGVLTRAAPLFPSEESTTTSSTSTSTTSTSTSSLEPDLAAVKAALAREGEERVESMVDMADSPVTWALDTQAVAAALRDQAIVQAAVRRQDEAAGQVVGSILAMLGEGGNTAKVSSHLGHHAIADRVAADHGKEGDAYRHLDQYLKLLASDRLVDKVGDAGGGQYSVDMEHVVRRLTEASLDCVVLERFGSKAQRIFRYVREKKYVEESCLQGAVMVPTKESKSLTYQLMEGHFLHLQELRKTLVASAPSKSFHLFYINFDQVVRHCLALCRKSMYNTRERAGQERADHARLLEKRRELDCMMARLREEEATEEQLQEVEELMAVSEREEVGRVHRRLEQLAMARIQAGETMFIMETFLYYRQA